MTVTDTPRSPTATARGRRSPAPRSAARRNPDRTGIAIALGVVATSWALAALGGAAGVPRTDDWAFARVAFDWAHTGHLRLVGWGQMSLVGLAAWALPWIKALGAHQWVVDTAGASLVAAGLVAAHRLARTTLDDRAASIAVLCVVVCPGFLRDATTFMTDGPALALTTICLLAGVRASRADGAARARWLLIALAFGFWAFTVRELAIAAPLALLGVELFARRSRRALVLSAGAALGVASVIFFVWRHGLPGQQPYWGTPPAFVVVELLVNAAFTVALGLVPALAYRAPVWWRARARAARAIGMAMGGVLALVPIAYARWSWGGGYRWLLGDYLDPRGINADKLLAGSRPVVLPAAVYALLTILAIGALIIVCGLIAEQVALRRAGRVAPRSPASRIVVAHLATGAAVLAVAAARNATLYDRYLWPLVLSGAIVVLSRQPEPFAASMQVRPRRAAPAMHAVRAVVVAAIVVVALVLTANSDAFDGARWRAASRAVAAGNAAATVDGGFEWVGAHAPGPADLTRGAPAPDRYRTTWARMFPSPTICIVESASPLRDPRLSLVGTTTWMPLLVTGTAHLFTYATAEPGCPRGRAAR